jgi:hypothetical protein
MIFAEQKPHLGLLSLLWDSWTMNVEPDPNRALRRESSRGAVSNENCPPDPEVSELSGDFHATLLDGPKDAEPYSCTAHNWSILA